MSHSDIPTSLPKTKFPPITPFITSHGVEGLVAGGAGAVLGPAAGAGVREHVVVPLDPPR